jgi:hypothetical protein
MNHFPMSAAFPSVEGWGIHLLASMDSIEPLNAQQLAARMPENAKKDLMEWNDSKDVPAYLASVVTMKFQFLRS